MHAPFPSTVESVYIIFPRNCTIARKRLPNPMMNQVFNVHLIGYVSHLSCPGCYVMLDCIIPLPIPPPLFR